MTMLRWIITLLLVMYVSVFPIEGLINAQFSLADINDGTVEGQYDVTFEIYSATENMGVKDPLWTETHDIYITEGQLIKTLGMDLDLIYHIFKAPKLYMRIVFPEKEDAVYVPMISVPAAIYSQYSDYAREIEYTEEWFKISTPDRRIGIGITQNLEVEFAVLDTDNDGVGTIYANVVTADAMFSDDGFGIHNIDYRKIVDIDDYSLHPDDADGIPYDSPDVVYVTPSLNVGIGFKEATANIESKLHVSGNVKIDYGKLYGYQSNIELIGTANAYAGTGNGPQLIWESNKSYFRAGYASGDNINIQANYGDFSSDFGRDNAVGGDYSSAIGNDNTNNADSSITIGKSNIINSGANYSGVLSGFDNQIEDDSLQGYSAIVGGQSHKVYGPFNTIIGGFQHQLYGDYSSILGGFANNILETSSPSDYSTILGGTNNSIDGSSYSIIAGFNARILDSHDGVFIFSGYDVDNSSDPYITSSASSQFLIYALNGVGVGTNGLDSISSDNFPINVDPSLELRDHSFRTIGDIVSMAEDGEYGFLVGDGTYITNIQSLWNSNQDPLNYTYATDVIYTEAFLVGIGMGSDETAGDGNRPEAFLHIQDPDSDYLDFDDFKAFKIQSNDLNDYLTLHIDTTDGRTEFDFSNYFQIQYQTDTILQITSANAYVPKKLGIKNDNPFYDLDVTGVINVTDQLRAGSVEVQGTVTANVFQGSGSGLTDVHAYFLSDESKDSYYQRVFVSDDGDVGIGITANAAQLLHLAQDSASPQLRLQNLGNTDGYYATFQSNDRLQMVFNGYSSVNDVIFSFASNSTTDGTGTVETLLQISATGNVSIGDIVPHGSHLLDVDGNINSISFSGNGADITNEQLDVPQVNEVTFNNRVTIADVIKLTPAEDFTCESDDVGVLFSIDDGGGNAIICACVGAGEPVQLAASAGSTGSCSSD